MGFLQRNVAFYTQKDEDQTALAAKLAKQSQVAMPNSALSLMHQSMGSKKNLGAVTVNQKQTN